MSKTKPEQSTEPLPKFPTLWLPMINRSSGFGSFKTIEEPCLVLVSCISIQGLGSTTSAPPSVLLFINADTSGEICGSFLPVPDAMMPIPVKFCPLSRIGNLSLGGSTALRRTVACEGISMPREDARSSASLGISESRPYFISELSVCWWFPHTTITPPDICDPSPRSADPMRMIVPPTIDVPKFDPASPLIKRVPPDMFEPLKLPTEP